MAKKKKRFVEDVEKLTDSIVSYLHDKKGFDVVKLDFENVDNVLFDYFVVCSGTSRTHTQTLADWVAKEVRREFLVHPFTVEGAAEGEWVLLDYGDTIVHIFQEDTRQYYNIEGLWADAERTDCVEVEKAEEKKKRVYKRKVVMD